MKRKSNIEYIEGKLIGALLHSPESIVEASEVVQPQHFYSGVLRSVYETMLLLADEYVDINIDNVALKIEDKFNDLPADFRDQLNEMLVSEMEKTPDAEKIKEYVSLVREKADQRMIKDRVSAIVDTIGSGESTTPEILDRLIGIQDEIGNDDVTTMSTPLFDCLISYLDQIERIGDGEAVEPRISTGLPSFDRQLGGGILRGKIAVFAGRPGHGKTALAMQVCSNFATQEEVVLVISLEMTKEELAGRWLSSTAGITEEELFAAEVSADAQAKVKKMVQDATKVRDNIHVDDFSNTPERIMSSLMRHHRKYGITVVMIDYVQDIVFPDSYSHQDLSNFLKRLSKYAKANNITVILVSQLKRDIESRNDKRPRMSDLSETKKLEEITTHAVSIYRDEIYNVDSEKKGMAEIGLMKNRKGPVGVFDLLFEGEYTRFVDPFS